MKRILFLTAAVLLISGTAAFAQPGPGMGRIHGGGPAGGDCMMHGKMGPDHHPGGCGIMNCAELELTAEQKEQIRDLMFDHHRTMIDLKATLEKAQLMLRHEMHSDSPDKARALKAARMVNEARGKMAEAKINHQFAMRDVLTPEQLDKWHDCRGKCGGGDRMGMHHRGGRDSGMRNMDRRRDGSCVKGK